VKPKIVAETQEALLLRIMKLRSADAITGTTA
jgi:hypothetical protein